MTQNTALKVEDNFFHMKIYYNEYFTNCLSYYNFFFYKCVCTTYLLLELTNKFSNGNYTLFVTEIFTYDTKHKQIQLYN